MAHGTPDWGLTAGAVTTYQLTDLGELAARLGSPDTFDRRGDVIWWDDFEWSLNKWQLSLQGTGAAAAISTVEARNGRCSVLLTAGSDSTRKTAIRHRLPFPVLGRLGQEISVRIVDAVQSVGIEILLYDGTNYTDYIMRWDNASNELRYLASNSLYVAFATGVDLAIQEKLFHTLKLVVDAASRQYVRAIVNEHTYSLSGIAGVTTPDTTVPHIFGEVVVIGRAGQNDRVYVDDAIVTQNEPA